MNEQPLNALFKGYRLHEYELVRPLGLGGFGMTYLGFDHHLNKPVAIKEYLPADIALRTGNDCVSPQVCDYRDEFVWGLQRFLEEARTLARFDHRNIIKVYRYFEANDTAYIVMEYAEGKTLSEILRRNGTVKVSDLKRIVLPILEGLQVVHDANFLHRDIKPGNIVLRDEDESPVLLDFGAARQDLSARSRSVTAIVTPGYAPIEQYTSRGHQGPWTDIYALGAVCYKALTGDTPVTAVDRFQDDPLVPITRKFRDQDEGLLKAIDWALRVREIDRPQSVVEWRSTLTTQVSVLESVPGFSDPPAPESFDPPRMPDTIRRLNKFVAWSFASPVLFGLFLISMVWILNSDSENEGSSKLLRRTELAAEQGESSSQYLLGYLYDKGITVWS